MIEIIAVILLCGKNSKNAKNRGKSGGAAIAYTLGLWFGGEILGFILGIAANGGEFTPLAYIAGLLFAVGGGVASYFIAKSGKAIAQYQPQMYPPPSTQQHTAYLSQSAQPAYINQQGQPLPPNPSQPPLSQAQPVQIQQQPETANVTFSAKKVMGQFLVSSVTIEINGVPYQTGFKQPISILAPAGNVHIACYLNYMGKSGVAQMNATLAPNQSYRIEYKSPLVVTGSGSLEIVQGS